MTVERASIFARSSRKKKTDRYFRSDHSLEREGGERAQRFRASIDRPIINYRRLAFSCVRRAAVYRGARVVKKNFGQSLTPLKRWTVCSRVCVCLSTGEGVQDIARPSAKRVSCLRGACIRFAVCPRYSVESETAVVRAGEMRRNVRPVGTAAVDRAKDAFRAINRWPS